MFGWTLSALWILSALASPVHGWVPLIRPRAICVRLDGFGLRFEFSESRIRVLEFTSDWNVHAAAVLGCMSAETTKVVLVGPQSTSVPDMASRYHLYRQVRVAGKGHRYKKERGMPHHHTQLN